MLEETNKMRLHLKYIIAADYINAHTHGICPRQYSYGRFERGAISLVGVISRRTIGDFIPYKDVRDYCPLRANLIIPIYSQYLLFV